MIVLADSNFRENLFPFTHIRHTADIRVGILTIREKWEQLTGEKIHTDEKATGTQVPANIIPTLQNFEDLLRNAQQGIPEIESETVKSIRHPHHIFQFNDFALRHDFALLTKGKTSCQIDSTNKTTDKENIFLEEGARVSHSILNASTGPIYIGRDAKIMEGSLIRGSFSLGTNSVVKMGSKIYGATTIGPDCMAGGEIKNSVLFANSNKAHDGYLGDSVIGEWCNLGAGTSNSNLKNTGGEVSYTSDKGKEPVHGGNKAGLFMGDYSRCAINTSFDTGSVVGVCCNIFGNTMPDKFTENFTWGNERYIFDKAIKHIDNWKRMKNKTVSPEEITKLRKLYGG